METKPIKQHMGIRAANAISNTIIHILLIVISVIWLIPFICIVLQSFRVESSWQVGYVIPKQWGFDNYVNLMNTNFPKWYLNTFITALITAALQTIIVLCMSYTLSRFRFKMRKPLMQFMLILGMFPGMLTMIILYRVLKDLGLTQANAVPGLILVYIASSGMGYYVSKGFFDTLPKSLDEAARVDGASEKRIFFTIGVPLGLPAMLTTFLFSFVWYWNETYTTSLYMGNAALGDTHSVSTLLMELSKFEDSYKAYLEKVSGWAAKMGGATNIQNEAVTMAGTILTILPLLIIYFCLQRYFTEAIDRSGITGE